MFLVVLMVVCLSVCYEWIAVRFYGWVNGGNRNKCLNFGGIPDRDPPHWQKFVLTDCFIHS